MPEMITSAATRLASVAVVISYWGTSGATVFTTLVLMTGITAAVPYAFSALAQLIWRFRDGHVTSSALLVRDGFAAAVGLALSIAFIYYSRTTWETEWYVYWGPFLMTAGAFVLGIPVYLAQRKHMTEPADAPSYK